MKFGLFYNTGYYGTDPDQMITVARHAEQCGFESLYVGEHIALYPGASVGPVTFPPSTPIAEPSAPSSEPGGPGSPGPVAAAGPGCRRAARPARAARRPTG